MYSVDRRLGPQEELLWESKRVCGVVTCSFAKPARTKIIVWETEGKVRIQQRYTGRRISYFIEGGAWEGGVRRSIPESHIARTVLHVHDHVELGVQRNSGKCNRWHSAGSERQDGKVI